MRHPIVAPAAFKQRETRKGAGDAGVGKDAFDVVQLAAGELDRPAQFVAAAVQRDQTVLGAAGAVAVAVEGGEQVIVGCTVCKSVEASDGLRASCLLAVGADVVVEPTAIGFGPDEPGAVAVDEQVLTGGQAAPDAFPQLKPRLQRGRHGGNFKRRQRRRRRPRRRHLEQPGARGGGVGDDGATAFEAVEHGGTR